jgi:2,3-bisphosphoglycerate-dependent phosphoglycerate mutase
MASDSLSHRRLVATLNERYLIGVPGVREVWLVRHGDAHGRTGGGITPDLRDPPLSPTGKLQAAALGKRLAPVKFHSIWTSNTHRTRDTASVIATYVPASVTVDARLREVVTDWELGRPSSVSGPDVYPFPEPADQVAGRMMACLREIVGQMPAPADGPDSPDSLSRAVAVTHDVAILVTVMTLLELKWGQLAMLMPLTSVSVIAFGRGKAVVRSIGDATHLAVPADGPELTSS